MEEAGGGFGVADAHTCGDYCALPPIWEARSRPGRRSGARSRCRPMIREQFGRFSRIRQLADVVPALGVPGRPLEDGEHLLVEQLFGFGQLFQQLRF